MKIDNFLFFILIPTFFIGFLFPPPALSAQAPLQIGEITAYTGDVMVRTKAKWQKVIRTPLPVFSSDKIVSNRGRAEITLVDGAILRVGVDSNISIYQKRGMSITKTSARQVNVLVGKVWFNVQVKDAANQPTTKSPPTKIGNVLKRILKSDPKITFRTPTMVAAVRGTSGLFTVNAEGTSSYGLTRGHAETAGRFQAIDKPMPVKQSDILKGPALLPATNQEIYSLPIQTTARQAMEATTIAQDREHYVEIITERMNPDIPRNTADTANLAAEASVLRAKAWVNAAQVAAVEAQRLLPLEDTAFFNRKSPWEIAANWLTLTLPFLAPNAQAAADIFTGETDYNTVLETARKAAEKAAEAQAQAKIFANQTISAPSLAAAQAAAEATKTAAAMSRTNANVSQAQASWGVASVGDAWWDVKAKGLPATASMAAGKAASTTTVFATMTEKVVQQASSLVNIATTSDSKVIAQVAAFAVMATAATAEANAAAAEASAIVAGAAAANETFAAQKAQKLSQKSGPNLDQANRATELSTAQIKVAESAQTEIGATAAISAARATAALAQINASAAQAMATATKIAATGDLKSTAQAEVSSAAITQNINVATKAATDSINQARIAADAVTEEEAQTAVKAAAQATEQAIEAAEAAEQINQSIGTTGGLEEPQGTTIIKGKKPSDFNHSTHRLAGITCGTCHHDTNNGPLTKKMLAGLKDPKEIRCTGCHNKSFAKQELRQKQGIFHALCRNCHLEIIGDKKGPNKCGGCHAVDQTTEEDEEESPMTEKYDTQDSNVCLACHNHKQKYDKGMTMKTIHRPFQEMQCKRCHIPLEDPSEPTKALGPQNKAKIRWLGKNYIPRRTHWFTVPTQQINKELLVVLGGGSHDQKETTRSFLLPDPAQMSELKDDKTPPKISGINVIEVQHGVVLSATINWQTNESSNSRIIYGFDNQEQTTDLDVQLVKDHQSTLVNLKPNQTYRFSVVCQDIFGNEQKSEFMTFSTASTYTLRDEKDTSYDSSQEYNTRILAKNFYKNGNEYFIKIEVTEPVTMFLATKFYEKEKSKGGGRQKITKWGNKNRKIKTPEIPDEHWEIRDMFEASVNLCTSCHLNYMRMTLHPLRVHPSDKITLPEDFPALPDGTISCVSCHDPHASAHKFLLRRDSKRTVCESCHRDKATSLPIFSH